jgi:anti-sigma-K factor RskA
MRVNQGCKIAGAAAPLGCPPSMDKETESPPEIGERTDAGEPSGSPTGEPTGPVIATGKLTNL